MSNTVSLTLRDFQLCNAWREDINGEKFPDGTVMYLIDQSTRRKYLNESSALTRFKFVLFAAVGTPIIHSISLSCHAVYRIAKLVTVSYFWIPRENEITYSFKARLEDAGLDLLKIVMTPIVLIGLEVSAVYGIFNPHDGRKVFASLERFQFNHEFLLSPCFQPDPTHHFFGGNLNQQNTF